MIHKMKKCEGCEIEMEECYYFQTEGYDAGLHWVHGHCFFFVLNKRGKLIAG